MKLRILFVDDEPHLREFMKTELPRLGHEVTVCPNTAAAVETLKKAIFDAAILDLKMESDTSGLQVLSYLKQVSPDTEAVIMTGYASQETTVSALRLGAFDYLTKPCKLADIEGLLLRIIEKKKLKNQTVALQTRVTAAEGPTSLIGNSPSMAPVLQIIDTVAATDGRVLITGETGTGKEVVARTLFMKSHRADMPFVPVNCGALAQSMAESELFGHKKGAFTGADRDRKGMFEVANGGTLFLDELGELDKNIQVKLLRFLEAGEIKPVGANEPIIVDVRVICATNRDLRTMVMEGQFREDLLYRLNMFHVHLPPLRERKGDIPDLAKFLLARAAKRPLAAVTDLLTPETIQTTLNYDWPGNVRELANAMEYAWIVSGGHPITPHHLPHDVRTSRAMGQRPMSNMQQPMSTMQQPMQAPPQQVRMPQPMPGQMPHIPQQMPPQQMPTGFATHPGHDMRQPVSQSPMGMPSQMGGMGAGQMPDGSAKSLADVEMEYILQVYSKHNGNKQLTASELGISLKTLYNKLHRYEQDRQLRFVG